MGAEDYGYMFLLFLLLGVLYWNRKENKEDVPDWEKNSSSSWRESDEPEKYSRPPPRKNPGDVDLSDADDSVG